MLKLPLIATVVVLLIVLVACGPRHVADTDDRSVALPEPGLALQCLLYPDLPGCGRVAREVPR